MMVPDGLKAFTDGVLAIIITIMVLELRVPHDAALRSVRSWLTTDRHIEDLVARDGSGV